MADLDKTVDMLIQRVSSLPEVTSVGISGGEKPFPKAGESDIDIFIYCDTIPSQESRQLILNELQENTSLGVFQNGHWGVGDFALVRGIEVWLMYFTEEEALNEVEAVLSGEYPDKLDNYYYPTGRCEMLRNMWIRYDEKGFLSGLQNRLSEYPESLSEKLSFYHIENLEDTEDLERAVNRQDVLFYHFALDISIDHFLQALFALNKTFFPSRKRSPQYIETFKLKPENCAETLLEVISLGGSAETIEKSYKLWCSLTQDLKSIV